MDKVILTFLGGDPDTLDALEFMQNGLTEAVKGLASVYQSGGSDPIIVSGLAGTVAGGIVTYTNGFVVVNGEVYAVTGGSFTNGDPISVNIAETFDPAGDEIFENLVPHQTFAVRRGTLQVTTGSPDEIDIVDFISLKSRFATLGMVINLETNFAASTLTSGWSTEAGEEPAKSRTTKTGDIEMCGVVRIAALPGSVNIITILPVAERPNNPKTFIVSVMVNTVFTWGRVRVNTNGEVVYIGTPGDAIRYLNLNQVRFPKNS